MIQEFHSPIKQIAAELVVLLLARLQKILLGSVAYYLALILSALLLGTTIATGLHIPATHTSKVPHYFPVIRQQ